MTTPDLANDLVAAWSALERQGAVTRRVPIEGLSRLELQALVWHEDRRVRALSERDVPGPPPFNWRAYRGRTAAWEASQRWVAA